MKDFISRRLGNYEERTITITTASFVVNALTGAGKLISGIYLLSPWFIANAVYYLLLCAARGQALKKYQVTRQIENKRDRYDLEFITYQRGGLFMCLMGIAYLPVCLRMLYAGDSTVYNGYAVIYGVAAMAFSKLGFAIYGTVISRSLKNLSFRC